MTSLGDDYGLSRDYPVSRFEPLLKGRTIISVMGSDCDEGFVLFLDDGTSFEFGFSSCEGIIRHSDVVDV